MKAVVSGAVEEETYRIFSKHPPLLRGIFQKASRNEVS